MGTGCNPSKTLRKVPPPVPVTKAKTNRPNQSMPFCRPAMAPEMQKTRVPSKSQKISMSNDRYNANEGTKGHAIHSSHVSPARNNPQCGGSASWKSYLLAPSAEIVLFSLAAIAFENVPIFARPILVFLLLSQTCNIYLQMLAHLARVLSMNV